MLKLLINKSPQIRKKNTPDWVTEGVSEWRKNRFIEEFFSLKRKKKYKKIPRKMIEVMIAILPIERAMSLFWKKMVIEKDLILGVILKEIEFWSRIWIRVKYLYIRSEKRKFYHEIGKINLYLLLQKRNISMKNIENTYSETFICNCSKLVECITTTNVFTKTTFIICEQSDLRELVFYKENLISHDKKV